MLPHLPGAIRLDRIWQKGVPDAWPAVGEYLHQKTGYNFPVLSRMRNARAIQAVASMVKENLDPDTTVIGLDTKILTGMVFSAVVPIKSLMKGS